MNNRRNPFEVSEPAPASVQPTNIHDSLSVAAPRKRNRQWEKEHQSHKVVYRGVDPKLALKVKSIAGELLVPTGEVARAVIEYSLRAYEQDDLDLRPRINPDRVRMTLFPAQDSVHPYGRPPRAAKRKKTEALWKVITTWRGFPPELKNQLAVLASENELNVPIGELITALLRFGLKAYDHGLLQLEPVQKAAAHTLAEPG